MGEGTGRTKPFDATEIRDAALAAMGLRILRIDARRIFNNEEEIRELLRRLV